MTIKSRTIRVDTDFAKKLKEEASKFGLKVPQYTRLKLKKWKKGEVDFKI